MQSNSPAVQELVAHSEAVHDADYAHLDMLREAAMDLPDSAYIKYTLEEMSAANARPGEAGRGTSIYSDPTTPRPSLQLIHDTYSHLEDMYDPGDTIALCRYIGEHVLPLTGIVGMSESLEFDLVRYNYPDHCRKAEPYFHDVLEQVTSNAWHGHPHVSVYHNTAGTPLMIRKTEEDSTALTLQPFELYGMPIPIGSIVKPSGAMNALKTGEVIHRSDEGAMTYSTYWIKGTPELALGRISAMAYARPLDRQLFALDAYYPKHDVVAIDREKMQQLEHMDIQAFQGAARKVMVMCGMRPPQPNLKEMPQLGIANTIGYIRDSLVEPAAAGIRDVRRGLQQQQRSLTDS